MRENHLALALGSWRGAQMGRPVRMDVEGHGREALDTALGLRLRVAIDTKDPGDLKLFEKFDWVGLISMAMFLGALEYVLEEGPRNDWFGDNTVLLLAWVAGISAVGFFARVLTARMPIVVQ